MSTKILLGLLLGPWGCIQFSAGSDAAEYVFRGTWQTVNRPLDGEMSCIVTPTARHAWQGRFYGIWQGVEFDYIVNFTGPPKDLKGSAIIDGASYEWRAWITRDAMRANFAGSRYEGSFDLKRISSLEIARKATIPKTTAASP